MNKPNALLILSPGFPKDEADSTCLPAQQVFVEHLSRNFPHISVIVLAFEYPFYKAVYRWKGATVVAFGGKNKRIVFRFFNWVSIWFSLKRLRNEYNIIGLLSFWMGECALIGSKFGRKYGIKHYSWLLGQDAKPGNKYCRYVLPASESLIAVSDFIAAEFHKNYGVQPANVVPLGIDPSVFGKASHERSIDILGAGSLIPLKQYHLMVSLVNELRDTFPGIKVVICGDGPEKESLKRMIRTLGLEDHITLTGEVPHQTVLNMMGRAKVFMHTSSYEGFAGVFLEALAAGAHVVSFVRPMRADIKNWDFAGSNEAMVEIVKAILQAENRDHTPVMPYLADDTTTAMMRLFDQSLVTIS